MCPHLGTFSRILENFLVFFLKNCRNDFLYSLSICEKKMSAYIPISIIVIIFTLEIAIFGDLGIKMKITALDFGFLG